ncbi:glutamate racemase [Halomonas urumqiensis]|uniref:Glutamate racemase n=1 Tax=Halomonas urumqiensis TaxID=1684789 RepID=A0A2N7UDZ6_9GAMM|nr:glutamate racemase [Halomonas urumqiensis]PMR78678.1 glutamate racemase [Halomonas urumqiensis]PTB04328.1 glutamate racemase [Halomonas urumqiensis]
MAGPVLVFDSGVGGLSVVSALRQRLPGAALAYVCDNAMLPYGMREDAWLAGRILEVCSAAVAASRCSALVVACNTASTLALAELREHLDIPVIGTVPAIKPAAGLSRTGHIGLLATSATVARPYTLKLIEAFASECRVTRVAADPLVQQAERWLAGEVPDIDVIRRSLAPLWEDPELDVVVLGCTHFPLLRDWLTPDAHREVAWVDSSDAIARRVAEVVSAIAAADGLGECFVTAPAPRLTAGFASFGFAPAQVLSLP